MHRLVFVTCFYLKYFDLPTLITSALACFWVTFIFPPDVYKFMEVIELKCQSDRLEILDRDNAVCRMPVAQRALVKSLHRKKVHLLHCDAFCTMRGCIPQCGVTFQCRWICANRDRKCLGKNCHSSLDHILHFFQMQTFPHMKESGSWKAKFERRLGH